MALIDITNIAAGAYKGYMNSTGVDVDSAYLGYILAGSSAISGAYRAIGAARHDVLKTGRKGNKLDDILRHSVTKFILGSNQFKIEDKNPTIEGVKGASLRTVISGIEIAAGYGIGYVTQKIIG